MKTLRRLGTLPVILAVLLSSPAHKALADQQPLDRPPRYEEDPEDPEKKRQEQEKAEKAREEERQARERERERQAGEDEQRRRDQENRDRDEERRNQEEQARERERRARDEEQRREDQRREDQRREDQRREEERRRDEDARREERERRDREDERRREEDARREERERRDEEERRQRQAEEDRRREDEARREREREERERGRDYYPPVYPEPTPPRYYPDPDPIPVTPPAPEPDDGSEGVYNCAAQFGPHCYVFSFWWAKPHREVKFLFQNGISLRQVKYLKLTSIMTNGLRGRTGTLGITEAKILLSNGGKIDVFKLAKKQFPQRVSKKGQLFLRSEGDLIALPLPILSANVKAVGAYIKADSWINPQTPAYLQVWFDSLNSQPLQLLKP